jgi:hypothetical protein
VRKPHLANLPKAHFPTNKRPPAVGGPIMPSTVAYAWWQGATEMIGNGQNSYGPGNPESCVGCL